MNMGEHYGADGAIMHVNLNIANLIFGLECLVTYYLMRHSSHISQHVKIQKYSMFVYIYLPYFSVEKYLAILSW